MRVFAMTCLISAALLRVPLATAQIKLPPETRNAALRYWMAFADLQDPPSDKETQELLEKTASGEAAWDEAKLGPILDKNADAIEEMQRATKLPDCDWGLEYNRGARASIAHLTRARVLARLNILYGIRAMARGHTQEAVDAWLDGVRFSQDLSKGGPLIFKLVADAALTDNFHAVEISAGRLQSAQKAKVTKVVRALPPDVFDWREALGLEESSLELVIEELRQASNPAAVYQDLYGQPMPANFALPSESEVVAFRAVIEQAEEALRLSPSQAAPQLEQLQERIAASRQTLRSGVPSIVKINDTRAKLETSREKLLRALAEK